jgi:hypothetical protein
MKAFASLASVITALVLTVMPASAATKHHRHHVTHAARGAYASQPQIACTVVGCIPIPRGCHPENGLHAERNAHGVRRGGVRELHAVWNPALSAESKAANLRRI